MQANRQFSNPRVVNYLLDRFSVYVPHYILHVVSWTGAVRISPWPLPFKRDIQNPTRVRRNALKSGHTVYVASTRIKCDFKLTVNTRQRVGIDNIEIKKIRDCTSCLRVRTGVTSAYCHSLLRANLSPLEYYWPDPEKLSTIIPRILTLLVYTTKSPLSRNSGTSGRPV
jgi:hypothetical protein